MCDAQTKCHQKRVSILSICIGKQMSLPTRKIRNIGVIGLIHDIGKMILPPEFLTKKDDLSPSELQLVRHHPQTGFDLIEDSGLPMVIKNSVLQHHERIDGSGYPQQLKGDQILLEAKVVAVADVIDAMTCHRPYNPRLVIDDALNEIVDYSGTHYDPIVVQACLAVFAMAKLQQNVATAKIRFLNHQPSCC
jgi:HD-GYP domain-containing protein (c-di-GMP phosphodiesterase class II)